MGVAKAGKRNKRPVLPAHELRVLVSCKQAELIIRTLLLNNVLALPSTLKLDVEEMIPAFSETSPLNPFCGGAGWAKTGNAMHRIGRARYFFIRMLRCLWGRRGFEV